MKTIKTLVIFLGYGCLSPVMAQITYESNDPNFNPTPLGYVGWNDNTNTDLNFRQNNIRRLRMTSVNWPGYNSAPATNNANRMFFGINGNNMNTPFSMLHLGYNINANLYRPWMNVGTTYGAGADIMYTGIMQSPGNSGNGNIIDAVVAWGDNDNFFAPANSPDNLRFIFLAPTGSNSPGSAMEGLETMRITPRGNVGIGDSFSNTIQPNRRTVIHEQTNSPQFRIAWSLNQNPVMGDHADFQVTQNGVLHIKPRHADNLRATTIGFLEGEQVDPLGGTVLDVGRGRTRIRQLPEINPDALIIGYRLEDVNQDDNDNFLGRLEFPLDDNLFLNGNAEWSTLIGEDCRWIDVNSTTVVNEVDIITGFPQDADCDRGKVGIGVQDVRRAKLEVENLINRDEINTAIYGGTDMDQQMEQYPDIYFGVYGETVNGGDGNYASVCGVKGYAESSRYLVGVFGETNPTAPFTNGFSMGVAGIANVV